MIHKNFDTGDKSQVMVTFMLLKKVSAQSIHLVGDFNNWHMFSHPLTLTENGEWVRTIGLEINQMYEYRYLIDGRCWMTEYPADGFVPGPDGHDNSVISTRQHASPDHDLLMVDLSGISLADSYHIVGVNPILKSYRLPE